MKPHEFMDEREPDAGAFVGAPDLTLDAMKAVEEARDLMRRDAGAGVADRELGASAAGRELK